MSKKIIYFLFFALSLTWGFPTSRAQSLTLERAREAFAKEKEAVKNATGLNEGFKHLMTENIPVYCKKEYPVAKVTAWNLKFWDKDAKGTASFEMHPLSTELIRQYCQKEKTDFKPKTFSWETSYTNMWPDISPAWKPRKTTDVAKSVSPEWVVCVKKGQKDHGGLKDCDFEASVDPKHRCFARDYQPLTTRFAIKEKGENIVFTSKEKNSIISSINKNNEKIKTCSQNFEISKEKGVCFYPSDLTYSFVPLYKEGRTYITWDLQEQECRNAGGIMWVDWAHSLDFDLPKKYPGKKSVDATLEPDIELATSTPNKTQKNASSAQGLSLKEKASNSEKINSVQTIALTTSASVPSPTPPVSAPMQPVMADLSGGATTAVVNADASSLKKV